MNGHGFIHFWRMLTDSGFIRVCSASSPLPGTAPIRFFGQDVTDQTLSAELSQRNINTKAECQPNNSNIRVRFKFGFDTSGQSIAVDVRRF